MRYGDGWKQSRDSRNQVTGVTVTTASVALTAAMMSEGAFARGVPGVALQDAEVRMLDNGNALVTYEGSQFAVPAGQFTQFNGVLVVSLPVAQVFAPKAVLKQQKILKESSANFTPSDSAPSQTSYSSGTSPEGRADVNAPGLVSSPSAPPAAALLTTASEMQALPADSGYGEGGQYANIDVYKAQGRALGSSQEKAKETSAAISYDTLPLAGSAAMSQTSSVEASVSQSENSFLGIDTGLIGTVTAVGALAGGSYFLYDRFTNGAENSSEGSTATSTATPTTTPEVAASSGDVTSPTISSAASATIDEGYSLGSLALDVNASDNEGGVGLAAATDAFKIISGNTDNAFTIDKDSGAITVANVSALDVDSSSGTTKNFVLTIEVQDANGNKTTQDVTITVNNLAVTSTGMQAVNLEGIYDSHRKSDVSLGDNANWFVLNQDKGLDSGTKSDGIVLHMNAQDGANDAMITMIYKDVASLVSDSREFDTYYQDVGDANLRSEKVFSSFTTQNDTDGSNFTASVFTNDGSADADFTWGSATSTLSTKTAMAVSTGLDGDTSNDTWDIVGNDIKITLSSGAGTLTIPGGASATIPDLYYDIGDADASGAMNELFIMNGDGILNTYRFDLGLNIFATGSAWDGLDLHDLADGKVDGNKGTAVSFMWLGGSNTTSAVDDQLMVVSSDGMAYIYDADF